VAKIAPDLDRWLKHPQVQIRHRREAGVEPAALWTAARAVRLVDARRLGRLIRLRIPGLDPDTTIDQMFRSPPFNVLEDGEGMLVAGLVGRIWTLRRDYALLSFPEEFCTWSARGTVRVLFANWVQRTDGGAALISETRVGSVDLRGRLGLAAVRPLIARSHALISSDGIDAALARTEQPPGA
jgi:hypothetical protein